MKNKIGINSLVASIFLCLHIIGNIVRCICINFVDIIVIVEIIRCISAFGFILYLLVFQKERKFRFLVPLFLGILTLLEFLFGLISSSWIDVLFILFFGVLCFIRKKRVWVWIARICALLGVGFEVFILYLFVRAYGGYYDEFTLLYISIYCSVIFLYIGLFLSFPVTVGIMRKKTSEEVFESVKADILRLDEMRDSGTISEMEYRVKKEAVLRNIKKII